MATKTEDTGPKPAAAATSPAEPAIQAEPGTPEPPAGDQLARSTQASQALAVARAGTMQAAFQGLIPTSIGEAFVWAGYLAKSAAVPASVRKGGPETVLTVILAGMELGLTPIRAVQNIINISGTLCMKADLQLALVKNRAVLAFYDEGFERFGQTDGNLGKRMQLALRKLAEPEDVELVVEKIAAAVSVGMKDGDPYGWAVGVRNGDRTIHVRTFTYADAAKAVIYEKDEDGVGKATPKALADKFNYKSFPGDMYPKRARTRLLQVVASDVTNGLPAVEAVEGGQIIDADFTVHHGADAAAADDVDTLLTDIRDGDPAMAATVESAFDQLKMGKAARLQRLTQFRGKPKDLLEWLKTEYAGRKGKGRVQPDVLSGDPPATAKPADPKPAAPAEPAKPAAPSLSDLAAQAAAGVTQAGEIIDADDEHEPGELNDGNATVAGPAAVAVAEAAAAAKPMTPARDLAARFKAGMKTF